MLLHDLLERSATRSPEAPCLRFRGRVLSYGEVDTASSRMANLLLRTGLTPGARTAIYAPKCPEVVLAMLATLKAGGVYVPIDPLAPVARACNIAADCGVSHLVTTRAQLVALLSSGGLPESARAVLVLDREPGDANWPSSLQVVTLRDVDAEAAAAPARVERSESDLAYVLYTSGSTGSPKGVMLSHLNALSFVEWAATRLRLKAEDRLSNHAPFHFDLTVFDLYAALHCGASVTLIDELVARTPSLLLQAIREAELSVWYSVPSALRLLLSQTDWEAAPPASLRIVVFAGEEYPIAEFARLFRSLPAARFFNFYGPTETNVCTAYEVMAADLERSSLPIGKSSSGAELTVCGEDGRPLPRERVGAIGELCVRGPTVFLGYWPARRDAYEPYMTGDRVAFDDAGNLLFFGRRDFMVKVRGYRIELREVELALASHPAVREAVVSAVEDPKLGRVLVAHLVANHASVSVLELKTHCATKLPSYMVPHRVQFLPSLPYTSTGKVDRAGLARGYESSQRADSAAAGRTS